MPTNNHKPKKPRAANTKAFKSIQTKKIQVLPENHTVAVETILKSINALCSTVDGTKEKIAHLQAELVKMSLEFEAFLNSVSHFAGQKPVNQESLNETSDSKISELVNNLKEVLKRLNDLSEEHRGKVIGARSVLLSLQKEHEEAVRKLIEQLEQQISKLVDVFKQVNERPSLIADDQNSIKRFIEDQNLEDLDQYELMLLEKIELATHQFRDADKLGVTLTPAVLYDAFEKMMISDRIYHIAIGTKDVRSQFDINFSQLDFCIPVKENGKIIKVAPNLKSKKDRLAFGKAMKEWATDSTMAQRFDEFVQTFANNLEKINLEIKLQKIFDENSAFEKKLIAMELLLPGQDDFKPSELQEYTALLPEEPGYDLGKYIAFRERAYELADELEVFKQSEIIQEILKNAQEDEIKKRSLQEKVNYYLMLPGEFIEIFYEDLKLSKVNCQLASGGEIEFVKMLRTIVDFIQGPREEGTEIYSYDSTTYHGSTIFVSLLEQFAGFFKGKLFHYQKSSEYQKYTNEQFRNYFDYDGIRWLKDLLVLINYHLKGLDKSALELEEESFDEKFCEKYLRCLSRNLHKSLRLNHKKQAKLLKGNKKIKDFLPSASFSLYMAAKKSKAVSQSTSFHSVRSPGYVERANTRVTNTLQKIAEDAALRSSKQKDTIEDLQAEERKINSLIKRVENLEKAFKLSVKEGAVLKIVLDRHALSRKEFINRNEMPSEEKLLKISKSSAHLPEFIRYIEGYGHYASQEVVLRFRKILLHCSKNSDVITDELKAEVQNIRRLFIEESQLMLVDNIPAEMSKELKKLQKLCRKLITEHANIILENETCEELRNNLEKSEKFFKQTSELMPGLGNVNLLVNAFDTTLREILVYEQWEIEVKEMLYKKKLEDVRTRKEWVLMEAKRELNKLRELQAKKESTEIFMNKSKETKERFFKDDKGHDSGYNSFQSTPHNSADRPSVPPVPRVVVYA